MFAIDASMYINALNPVGPGSVESQAFLVCPHQGTIKVYLPTLLIVEVATSVARVFDDEAQGIALMNVIR